MTPELHVPCAYCEKYYPSPHAVQPYDGIPLCPSCAMDAGFCITCGEYLPDEINKGDLGLCYACEAEAWQLAEESDHE